MSYPWVVIRIWCGTQYSRWDFAKESEARSFAAKQRAETRDRVIVVEPDGYMCELKEAT